MKNPNMEEEQRTERMKESEWDLDSILNELGTGRFQYNNLFLMGLILACNSIHCLSYVFTAAELNYRCLLPECENGTGTYETSWIENALPRERDGFAKCSRYAMKPGFSDCTDPYAFDNSTWSKCDRWIFSNEETSIASSFNIACDMTKLTFVGTLNNIAQFVGMPLSGIISDKYGRKSIMIYGSVLSSIFGILKSYSHNYVVFLIFEGLDSITFSGVYSSTFILAMELVCSKKRPLAGTIVNIFYPVGAILMGFVAWWVRDWRIILRSTYAPGILFIFYFWLVPESVRWLFTQNRRKEAVKIIKTVANTNKTLLPVKVESSKLCKSNNSINSNVKNSVIEISQTATLIKALKSKTILFRVILCSYCWIAMTLVYYGLSLNSVDFPVGDKYMNFILSNFIEIPAGILVLPVMKYTGRRFSLSSTFILSGFGCILCNILPLRIAWLQQTIFTTSKLMITLNSNIIFMYTAEIFPTDLRVSLMAACSTIGRFGSMIAPQTPLLTAYFGPYATLLFFGAASFSAGILMLFLPETKNIKLPDTLEEVKTASVKK